MHTADLLHVAEFGFARDGGPADLADLLPDLEPSDRIGIVSARPGDALLAAPLLLAAIGSYYAALRSRLDSFYRYPNFFVLHLGTLHGRHSPLDVWPQSKEVVVPAEPQSVLAAVNDRAITRLVLPDLPAAPGELMRHAVEQAEADLRTVLVTRAEPVGGDVVVTPSPAAGRLVSRSARVSADLLGPDAERWVAEAERPRGYAVLDRSEAFGRLCGLGSGDPHFGFDADYRERAGIGPRVLDRDRHPVIPG